MVTITSQNDYKIMYKQYKNMYKNMCKNMCKIKSKNMCKSHTSLSSFEPIHVQVGGRSRKMSTFKRMQRRVYKWIDTSPCVVFYKETCPYSMEALDILNKHGFNPETKKKIKKVEITKGPTHDILKKLNIVKGQVTVPYVFIEGKFIGGCDDLKLHLRSG